MDAINRLMDSLNASAADYVEANREKIEGIKLTDPANHERINELLIEGLSEGKIKYADLNREQKRRAKKFLAQYRKKMNI